MLQPYEGPYERGGKKCPESYKGHLAKMFMELFFSFFFFKWNSNDIHMSVVLKVGPHLSNILLTIYFWIQKYYSNQIVS